MRKNYDFRVRPPKLSADQIHQHKNFDQLLTQFHETEKAKAYTSRPANRVVWLRSAAFIAAATALFFVFRNTLLTSYVSEGILRAESTAFFEQQPLITPPLPQISVPQIVNTHSSTESISIKINGGGEIFIPPAAFVTTSGGEVSGQVDIRYRTYNDQADLLVSGFPMEYRTAEEYAQLEAIGVVEVLAFQNGEPLQLAPEKSIDISFTRERFAVASPVLTTPKVFFLDQNSSTGWQGGMGSPLQQEETLVPQESEGPLFDAESAFRQKKNDLENQFELKKQEVIYALNKPQRPEKPELGVGDRASFNLAIDAEAGITWKGEPNAFDATILENSTWIVQDESADFDLRALTVVWERIEVEPLTDNRYRISFHQGDARDEVVVKPLLSPTEYASLLAEYEKQLLVWESEIIQYDSTVASQLAILEDDHLDRLNTISQSYQKTLDSLSGGNMQGLATRTVYAFSIAQLGTWSCAIPFIPTEEVIVDQLKTVDGNPLTDQVAYLIDRKVNTIYRFYLGADGALLQFSTNPESDFVLILSETNATVFASSDMGLNEYLYQVPRRMKSVVLHDRHTITSVEEIRKILTI